MILLDAAAHTLETHVKGFGALLTHVFREDAVGGRAVSFDRSGRLWVTHFDEGCADGNNLLSIRENRSSFAFCRGKHDSADGLKFGEYRSIRGWSGTDVGWWWIVA